MSYLDEISYPTYGICAWYAMTGEAEASLSDLGDALDTAGVRVKLSRRPTLEQAFKKACASGVSFKQWHLTKAIKNVDDKLIAWINYTADDGEEICEGNFILSDGEIFLQQNGSQFGLMEASIYLEETLKMKVEIIQDSIDSTLLRQLIPKHFLEELGGVRLKSGLFFFEADKCEHLEKLAEICNDQISHSQMELLPLPRDKRQGAMLAKAFDEVIVSARKEFEAAALKASADNPTLRAVKDMETKYAELNYKTTKFNEILGLGIWTSSIYTDQFNQIMEQVNG